MMQDDVPEVGEVEGSSGGSNGAQQLLLDLPRLRRLELQITAMGQLIAHGRWLRMVSGVR